jgi:hypothetical protein
MRVTAPHMTTPKLYTSAASVTASGSLMISGAIHGSVPRKESTPVGTSAAAAVLQGNQISMPRV